MTKERFAYDTQEEFLEAVHMYTKNYDGAAIEIWNDIQKAFPDGKERRLLTVHYDSNKDSMSSDVFTTPGEIAFIVAHLMNEELERNHLVVYDENFISHVWIEFSQLESDEEGEDDDGEFDDEGFDEHRDVGRGDCYPVEEAIESQFMVENFVIDVNTSYPKLVKLAEILDIGYVGITKRSLVEALNEKRKTIGEEEFSIIMNLNKSSF